MGKSGDALREAKKNVKKWHFTDNELAAHDKLTAKECLRRYEEELKRRKEDADSYYEAKKVELVKYLDEKQKKDVAEANKRLDETLEREWESRKKEFLNPDVQENFLNYMKYLLSVSVAVLVEDFGWKPVRSDGKYASSMKLAKFSDCVLDRINEIMEDECKDIRSFSDEVHKKYGVGFKVLEE